MTCADVNECDAEPAPCHANATCSNSDGSFSCACNTGLLGDGKSECDVPPQDAVDECVTGAHDCDVTALPQPYPGDSFWTGSGG